MKNKISQRSTLLILLIVIMLPIVAQSVISQNDYTFAQFTNDFKKNPVAAARNHPEKFAEVLKVAPELAGKQPRAYETLIRKNVKYINKNKKAFQIYAQRRGISFTQVAGDFKSFDVRGGTITTKSSSFSFRDITALKKQGASDFRILPNGKLFYSSKEDKSVLVEGKIKKSRGGDGIEVENGKIAVPEVFGGKQIEVVSGNKVTITGCVDKQDKTCVGLRAQAKRPMNLAQHGTLVTGEATVHDDKTIDVKQGSIFIDSRVTSYAPKKGDMRIDSSTKSRCGEVKDSCVHYDSGKKQLEVKVGKNNVLEVKASDREYDSIVVQEIEDKKSSVALTLQKADKSTTSVIFSENPPIAAGFLDSIHTNLGHVFEKDGLRYPFTVYEGEVSYGGKGGKALDISSSLISLTSQESSFDDIEKTSLILDSAGSLKELEAGLVLAKGGNLDEQTLRQVVDKVKTGKGKKQDLAAKMFLLSKIGIDSPAARKLQEQLLDEAESAGYSERELARLFPYVQRRVDLQMKVLFRTLRDDPGQALRLAITDKDREQIISMTRVINVYEPKGKKYGSTYYLKEYLSEVERLSPELKRKALLNLDYGRGVFVHKFQQGSAIRNVLISAQDQPELLKSVLGKMLQNKDVSFNPDSFAEIYFDPEFEKKTRGLDFASKYSVALTADRYLGQKGKYSSAEISSGVSIIIQQREEFSKEIIMGEDTYYIPIAHSEYKDKIGEMISLARDAGVKDIAAQDLVGVSKKDEIVKAIGSSKGKGKTLIHINGHANAEYQALTGPGRGVSPTKRKIRYQELGDLLKERGNLEEVTLMLDSCKSKDYADNLNNYLDSIGVKEKPTIITATNRKQLTIGDYFFDGLKAVHQKGQPLTGKDILATEQEMFEVQDMAIIKPTMTIGSTFDEGEPGLPTERSPERVMEISDDNKQTFIEISQNEQQQDEILTGIS